VSDALRENNNVFDMSFYVFVITLFSLQKCGRLYDFFSSVSCSLLRARLNVFFITRAPKFKVIYLKAHCLFILCKVDAKKMNQHSYSEQLMNASFVIMSRKIGL